MEQCKSPRTPFYDAVIATDDVVENGTTFHHVSAVLRPDQLDLIREIVRNEIAASRAKGGVW
jgi:hypothetical protein